MGDKGLKAYFGQKVDLGFQDGNIEFSDDDENLLEKCENNLTLYCGNSSQLYIGESIGDGGEGTVYRCNYSGFVAKIYKKDFRKISTQRKIEKLIKNNPNRKNLCWPIEALYYKDKFVGFLMPLVEGKRAEVLTTGCDKNVIRRCPKYTKDGQIRMILSILREIEYLHSIKILLGDINARNIMFDPQTLEITLVDIDSVQIEEFPCITSSPGYDAPEVIVYRAMNQQGRIDKKIAKEKDATGAYVYNNYYHNFYRTLENEYHAIAVLLYKLMTNGCMPYSYAEYGYVDLDEGYEDIDLQIDKSFPYTLDRSKLCKYCTRKEIWSHMPSFIKEAFVNTFTGKKRLTTKEWIVLFEHYEKLLRENRINDPEAHLAFATKEISYSDVEISLSEEHIDKGFLMTHAVARVMKPFNDENLKSHIIEVAEALKHKPIYMVDRYTFSLVYNIGILKKVKAEMNI